MNKDSFSVPPNPTVVSHDQSSDASVRFENVFKSFQGGKEHVLDGVSLTFPARQCTYVLGPSGAGKSVIFRLILGLMTPDAGKIWIGQNELATLDRQDLAQTRNRFGALFQGTALFDDLTVYDNVAFPLLEHTAMSEAEMRPQIESLLATFGVSQDAGKYPSELSGGMRKRVALARSIIRNPDILLCDEPTTGLDPVTRSGVDKYFTILQEKYHLTLIIISHDILSALKNADRIAFLSGGKMIFFGTPEEFENEKDHPIIRAFLEAESRAVEILHPGPKLTIKAS